MLIYISARPISVELPCLLTQYRLRALALPEEFAANAGRSEWPRHPTQRWRGVALSSSALKTACAHGALRRTCRDGFGDLFESQQLEPDDFSSSTSTRASRLGTLRKGAHARARRERAHARA